MGQVLAIKRVANVRLGKMVQPTPATGADVEAEYLRAAHVQPAGRLVEVAEKVMWFSPEELRGLNLTTGDVVVVEGGAGFGRSAHIDSPLDGWGYQTPSFASGPAPVSARADFSTTSSSRCCPPGRQRYRRRWPRSPTTPQKR